jgi:hypothetical protein
MGKGEGSSAETQASDLGSRHKKNRGCTAGTVGEGEDGEDEGCLEYRNRKSAAQVAAVVFVASSSVVTFSEHECH